MLCAMYDERGQGKNPLPLIITHGWPSTFYQMHRLIPLLTDPAQFGADPADSFWPTTYAPFSVRSDKKELMSRE